MPDEYAQWDGLLRTSRDRAQAEQIARACGVAIRPEPPPPPPAPDKTTFPDRLLAARNDPGLLNALVADLARPSVSRDDLTALAGLISPELRERVKRLPKAKQIAALRTAALTPAEE